MTMRSLLRTPVTVGLALLAVAATCVKKSRTRNAAPVSPAPPAQDLKRHNEELTRLAHQLLTGGEEEKGRIARDLHDGLGSTLTAVNLDLYWVQQRLADQPALASRLARAIEVLASTVEMKRRIIHSLRPAALDNLGLSLAIESHVAEFEKDCPATVQMDLPAELPALSSQASIALFRIYQQALSDAMQAKATVISVAVRDEGGAVILEVSDDGSGIGDQHAGKPVALGLLTMRERAAALDGTLTITRGAGGHGTVVTAFLPRPFQELPKSTARGL